MRKIIINDLLVDLNIFDKDYIVKSEITEENRDKVFKASDGYRYIYQDHGLSDEEIRLIIAAKQAKDIRSIKRMVMFFVILTCIAIAYKVIIFIYSVTRFY